MFQTLDSNPVEQICLGVRDLRTSDLEYSCSRSRGPSLNLDCGTKLKKLGGDYVIKGYMIYYSGVILYYIIFYD